MSEKINSKKEENVSESNQDVVILIKRMQAQLNTMEEKIDSLIRQTKLKPVNSKYPEKPYKEYDKAKGQRGRKYEGKKEEDSSKGKFYHGHPFAAKKDGGKGGFKKGKKPFSRDKK